MRTLARLLPLTFLLAAALAAPSQAALVRTHSFELYSTAWAHNEIVAGRFFDVLNGWVQDDWADVVDPTDPDSAAVSSPGSITLTQGWLRCDDAAVNCQPIAGEHEYWYFLSHDDIGGTVRATQTAVSASGETATVISDPTDIVQHAIPFPSSKLSATTSIHLPGSYFAYNGEFVGAQESFIQWERCDGNGYDCVDIPGANDRVYTWTNADLGHRLRVRMWGTNDLGTSPIQRSPATGVVGSDYPDSDEMEFGEYPRESNPPKSPKPTPLATATPAPAPTASPIPATAPTPTPTPRVVAPAPSLERTADTITLRALTFRPKKGKACPKRIDVAISIVKSGTPAAHRRFKTKIVAGECQISGTIKLTARQRKAARLRVVISGKGLFETRATFVKPV